MSPLTTHRRARRRSSSRRLIAAAVVVVIVALLVGGVTQVGRRSGPFDASMNRSFAVQGAVLAEQSNGTASSVRHLMSVMPQQGRRKLETDLDGLVAEAAQQAELATALAQPAPAGGLRAQFAAVFTDRAAAVRQVRSAIDGLLGMHPFAVAGAPKAAGTAVATPTLLSSAQATTRIAAAGTLLARADRTYRAVRRALPRLAGRARLPASTWIAAANPWQAGAVATQVDLVAASTSLVATHRLVLRAVQVTPPALPPPSGVASPTVSILSPTKKVTLSVVLSNLGSVDEPHAAVHYTLTPLPSGAAVTLTRSAAIASEGSVTLSLASFSVKPGTTYQLTVAVVLPAAQTDLTGASLTEMLQVAPQ
jgi:hypothetical protein